MPALRIAEKYCNVIKCRETYYEKLSIIRGGGVYYYVFVTKNACPNYPRALRTDLVLNISLVISGGEGEDADPI